MDELILALIEEIRKQYKDRKAADLVFKKLMQTTAKAESYEDAYAVAKRSGILMEDSIMKAWNELMKGADVYASTMKEVLYKVAPNMADDVLAACEQIQKNKNLAEGIGLKPQLEVPSTNELSVIGEQMDGKKVEDIDSLLVTYASKVVDLTIQANTAFAMSSGFEVRVTRKYDGVGLRRGTKHSERCAYCLERVGTKTFSNSGEASASGIFARHDGCGCSIDYENIRTGTRNRSVQNARNANKKRK